MVAVRPFLRLVIKNSVIAIQRRASKRSDANTTPQLFSSSANPLLVIANGADSALKPPRVRGASISSARKPSPIPLHGDLAS